MVSHQVLFLKDVEFEQNVKKSKHQKERVDHVQDLISCIEEYISLTLTFNHLSMKTNGSCVSS